MKTSRIIISLILLLLPSVRAASTTVVIDTSSRNSAPTNSNFRANKYTVNANVPYDASTWTNSLDVPSQKAVADKIESMGSTGGGGGTVGTMINSGSSSVGSLPRATDTTGTNFSPSSIIVTGSLLAAGTLTEGGNAVPNSSDNLSFFAVTSSAQLAGILSDETGSGLLVFGTSPILTSPSILSTISFPDGVRQTFNPNATTPGLNVGAQAGDPSGLSNGDIWYDSTGNLLRARIGGVSTSLGAGGGGSQTPWGTDINAATFSLTNATSIQTVGGLGSVAIGDTGTHWFSLTAPTTISTNVNIVSPTAPEVGFLYATVTTGTNWNLHASNILAFDDGVRQTFNPNATTPGVNVGSQAGDPSTPSNGDVWYDSTGNLLRARINGVNTSLGIGGAATNAIATISSNGVNIALVATNLNIAGLKLMTNVSGNITLDFANIATTALEFIIGDNTNTVGTGIAGYIEVPFDCTINRATLTADASGSAIIDIWKDTYANYPPTVADTITASALPTLASSIKSQDSTLTGWTTTVTAGDWLGINVNSATTVKRITLSLRVLKK